MGHLTYEEQYVDRVSAPDSNDIVGIRFQERCHPNFCQICFSKMYNVEVGGGDLVLKTELIKFTEEGPEGREVESRIYEPDGYGGCNTVAIRPHIVHGTACGWGSTKVSTGANLWHATIGTSNVSICQHGDTFDEAVETMFLGNDDMTLKPHRDGSRRLNAGQIRAACDNPRLMSAKCFDPKPLMPTIDDSMPEDYL